MTFYRLPADKLISYAMEDYTGGRLLFKTEEMSPRFPGGYEMKAVSYGILLGNVLLTDRFDSLTINLDYKRLMLGYLPITFNGLISSGGFNGKAGVSLRNRLDNSYFSVKASDIHLKDIHIISSFSNRNLKGRFRGKINIEGNFNDPTKINGNGHFFVENGSIDTRIDLPGLNSVPFKSIELDFSIEGGIMTLKKGEMNGPLFSGNYSGEIKLKKKISRSRIKINGTMKPGPMLENNQFAKQFLSKIRKGNNPINIKILGTLERPSIIKDKS